MEGLQLHLRTIEKEVIIVLRKLHAVKISHFVVTGPYLKRIIVGELGAPPSSIINCIPKKDFGGI